MEEVSAVMNGRRMPMRLEVKVNITIVRPVMMYGSVLGVKEGREEVETTKIKMLRRMLSVTLKDRMKKEEVKIKTIVTRSVVTEIEVNKLRW